MTNPYISEIKYAGSASRDFVEIAVDAGTDVTNMSVTIYNEDGTVRSVSSLGSIVNTIDGKDVYVIDNGTASFTGLSRNGGAALDNNGTVFQFLSFTNNAASITATEGAASGLTSTEIGKAGGGHSLESNDDGTSYFDQSNPNSGTIPACFVDGTLILTPAGEKPVEELMAGDIVITQDHGAQPLRWIGSKEMPLDAGRSAPIRIAAGAFGKGTPTRALYVSPYHRILLDDVRLSLLFGQQQMLVPAVHMVDGGDVVQQTLSRRFSYFHLLFDQHEIVFSNGLASESFYPAHAGLDAFSLAAKKEVLNLFPELAHSGKAHVSVARSVLMPHEAVLLTS